MKKCVKIKITKTYLLLSSFEILKSGYFVMLMEC